ncbi:MAG TPA: DNA polymerase IV, partial [Orrella sp.]
WPLPVSKVNGIGPKATAKLNGLGIQTIGELAQVPVKDLQVHFGVHYGHWLHQASHGRDDRPLETSRQPKSLSRETTFERNLHVRHDRSELTEIVNALCRRVSEDLQRKSLTCRTVGLKVKFSDFSVVTRDVSVSYPVQSADQLRQVLADCLRRVHWHDRIRLLGVRASGLHNRDAEVSMSSQLEFWLNP